MDVEDAVMYQSSWRFPSWHQKSHLSHAISGASSPHVSDAHTLLHAAGFMSTAGAIVTMWRQCGCGCLQ